jgi:4-amino-4-deoxy-L-arabinose transferase-like glycosyltransferase
VIGPGASDDGRARFLAWIALCAAAVVCYLVFLNPVPDFYPEQQNDPFTYISLAKSLAAGNGYPTKHWFPGFPALLAVLVSLFGLDFAWLKLSMIGTAALLAVSCYWYFRNLVSTSEARYLALLVLLVPSVFEYSHKLMAEIPCLAFAMLTLAAVETLRRAPDGPGATRWTIVLVLACAASVAIRGNSLALVPALAVALVPGGRSPLYRQRCAMAIVAALVVFGSWNLRNRSVEYSGIDNVTYTQEVQALNIGAVWRTGGFVDPAQRAGLRDLVRRVYENVAWYQAYNVVNAVFPGAGSLRDIRRSGLGLGLALLLASPVLIGAWAFFRASPAGAVYLLASLAMILVYPTGGAPRMLVSSIPPLVLSAYFGFRAIGGMEFSKGWLVTAACVGLFTCAVAGQRQQDHPYSFDGFADFLALLHEAGERHAQPVVALVSDYPQVVAALSTFRPDELPRAVDDLKSGRASTFLMVDGTVRGGSATPLPGDLSRSLLSEDGEFRLWQVALAAAPRQ